MDVEITVLAHLGLCLFSFFSSYFTGTKTAERTMFRDGGGAKAGGDRSKTWGDGLFAPVTRVSYVQVNLR